MQTLVALNREFTRIDGQGFFNALGQDAFAQADFDSRGKFQRKNSRQNGVRFWLTTSGCLIDLEIQAQTLFADVVGYGFRNADGSVTEIID